MLWIFSKIVTTNPRRIASLWLLASLEDPTANSEVTFTYIGMRMITMLGPIIPHEQRVEQCSPPHSQAGASGIAQEEQIEEIPWSPPAPRDQVPKGPEDKTLYSWNGANLIESIINLKRSVRLVLMFLQHSRVLLRNVILLTLSLERQAGPWLKECSIHKKLGLPRKQTLSWTNIWL